MASLDLGDELDDDVFPDHNAAHATLQLTGEKTEENEDHDGDIFVNATDATVFNTEVANIPVDQAKEMAVKLADNATAHALTAQPVLQYPGNEFYGVLIDTGAADMSTAGFAQFEAYRRHIATDIQLRASNARIRFSDHQPSAAIGSAAITIPIGRTWATVVFHILPTDTPFILCLRDMDLAGIRYDNLTDTIHIRQHSQQVIRFRGHAFLTWGPPVSVHLTEPELRRLHRRFGHPHAHRLSRLLTTAGHDAYLNALRDISKFCKYCQRHGKAPGRFKFTLRDPENMTFNHTVYVDVMYLSTENTRQQPVLYVVDLATRFQAARFLKDITAHSTWEALRNCWIDVYVGPPDVVTHDSGRNFVSHEFQENAHSFAIRTKCVPVEAANSMGLVERYHTPLRRAYQIIADEVADTGSPKIGKAVMLQMAVKSVNDTAGPDGLVPTLLVFGTIPRLSMKDAPSPTIQQRAKAIEKAMHAVAELNARYQVNRALATRNGPDVLPLHDLAIGHDVLVWRAHKKSWTGPYQLLGVDGETCKVKTNDGTKEFRSTVVKPFFRAPEYDDANADSHTYNSNASETPAHKEKQFEHSRQLEINTLLDNGVIRPVSIDSIDTSNATVFGSRFVDKVKNAGTEEAYEKSRLVIQAWNDRGRESILTQAPSVQRCSQRLILAMAATYGLSIALRDVTQAYTQSGTAVNRTVYVRPPQWMLERNIVTRDQLLHVMKPLYGLPESGTHWFNRYYNHHIDALGMKPSTYDACLLYHLDNDGHVDGLVGLMVDDSLIAGTEAFLALEDKKLKESGIRSKISQALTVDNSLTFGGCLVSLNRDGSINYRQRKQLDSLQKVAIDPPIRAEFAAQRARGAWVASNCQPEATFDYSFAAQATEPSESDVKKLNGRIIWQQENRARGLRFVPLARDRLQLVVFTDAAFANNRDGSSQIGFVLVLTDGKLADIVHWSSVKCRRITRSILAAELFAVMLGFDASAVIRSTLELFGNKKGEGPMGTGKIPLILATDPKSLYECLIKLGTTTEKRLMVDVMLLRQAYERRLVTEVVWIEGKDNVADAMTKSNAGNALTRLVNTNAMIMARNGWVDR